MGLKSIDVIAALLINLIQYSTADHILSCNVTEYGKCPGNQYCSASTLQCTCMKGLVRVGEECENPDDGSNDHSTITVATVTVFTLALLITAAVLVEKKYHVIDYVRRSIGDRANNNDRYEDMMIGSDDPPLNP